MRAYLEISETQARAHPGDENLQLERAYGHGNVGSILEAQDDLRDALGHYRTSFAIKQLRVQRDPSDVGARAELARAINKIGHVQQALGDFGDARTQYESEVATYRVLVQTDPRQAQWKQRLGASLAFLSAVRSYMGDLRGGLENAEEALSIDEQLATLDPENVVWQRDYAVALWRVADLRMRGDAAGSLDLLAKADGVMRALQTKAPDRAWGPELAGIEVSYARMLSEAGQLPRAQQMLMTTLKTIDGDRSIEARARAAEGWFLLGEIYRTRKERTQALAAWSRAEAVHADIGPRSTDLRRLGLWVRILARLGRLEEARSFRSRLQTIGYEDRHIDKVCSEEGC
jgi:tetratricopeptide (TPR) repeat protein